MKHGIALSEYLMLYAYVDDDGEEREDVMPIRAYSESQANEIAKLLCSQNGYHLLMLELSVALAM